MGDRGTDGVDTSAEADISAWLPADPRDPMYARYVEDVQYSDALDRSLVVAALDALLAHGVHANPVVWEATALVPSGSYRTHESRFIELDHACRDTPLQYGSVVRRHEGPAVVRDRWVLGDELPHRQGSPAETWYSDGEPYRLTWCAGGVTHRDGAPASVCVGESGFVERLWCTNGVVGRGDGPFMARWHPNGSIALAVRAVGHDGRPGGRTVGRWWRADGTVEEDMYYDRDRMHRAAGAAWVRYDPEGRVCLERWVKAGALSRADGPAERGYLRGVLVGEAWWTDGWLSAQEGPALWQKTEDGMLHEIRTFGRPEEQRPSEYTITDRAGRTTVVTDGTHPASLFRGQTWPPGEFRMYRGIVLDDFAACLLPHRPTDGRRPRG